MGIRFTCPNGHALHVKEFLAGKRGICPSCGAKFVIPEATEPTNVATATAAGGTASVAATGNGAQSEMRSVVIPVIETQAAPVPNATTERAERTAPQEVSVSRPVEDAPVVERPLSVLADADRSVSPAVKYIAQRERARRNRTKLAVLLLVAVIALAAALVWTLAVGPAAFDSMRAKPAFPQLSGPALTDITFSPLSTAR